MNKIIITGNLAKDPDLRYTGKGTPVCNFTVAVNKPGKKDDAEFFKITAWRKLAESTAKYLYKGRKILVEGNLTIQKNEHNGTKYVNPIINARNIEYLSWPDNNDTKPKQKPEKNNNGKEETFKPGEQYDQYVEDEDEFDVPF